MNDVGESKMSIDTRLMRKAIRRCGTRSMTREVVEEFEEKYLSHASTTEEAAGLAILLSQMQCWRDNAMFFGAGMDRDSVEDLLQQESYPIARSVSAYLVRPDYENRGFRGVLSFVFSPWHEFPLTDDTEQLNEYNQREWNLAKRLDELYWQVVDGKCI